MWIHRLSNIDEVNGTGDCANCGRVNLYKKPAGGWRCRVAKREHRGHGGKLSHGLNSVERSDFIDGKKCEICGSTEKLVVDHDHISLKVRGVLCHWCNVGIGMMKDDPVRLRVAADYLEK